MEWDSERALRFRDPEFGACHDGGGSGTRHRGIGVDVRIFLFADSAKRQAFEYLTAAGSYKIEARGRFGETAADYLLAPARNQNDGSR